MIYEAVEREHGITLNHISATVEADLDPRWVADADVDPRIRAFRVMVNLNGPTVEEAEMMADEWRTRCPIYTTLERFAPIEISHTFVTEDGDVIREVDSNLARTLNWASLN